MLNWSVLIGLVVLLIFGLWLAPAACTDGKNTKRVLEQMGYSNVEIRGYAWWGCGQDDRFHTKFRATSPAGKIVYGVGCSGWFKGVTIRFD